MKRYLLTEKQLLELLESYHRLSALESGGVDNWSWYGESNEDYLAIDNDESFEDCARRDLKDYICFYMHDEG